MLLNGTGCLPTCGGKTDTDGPNAKGLRRQVNLCRVALASIATIALACALSTWLTCFACNSTNTRPVPYQYHVAGIETPHLVLEALAQTLRSGGTHPPGDAQPQSLTDGVKMGIVLNGFRNDVLMADAILHYARCSCVGVVHVVWGDNERPLPVSVGHLVAGAIQDADAELWSKLDLQPATINRLLAVPVVLHAAGDMGLNERFVPHPRVLQLQGPWEGASGPAGVTSAPVRVHGSMFHVDDDMRMRCMELCSGSAVAQRHPRRLVGFDGRQAKCTRPAQAPQTGCLEHQYSFPGHFLLWRPNSIVLTKNAFVPNSMLSLYWSDSPATVAIRRHVKQGRNCEDIGMQLVASHATGLGPVELRFSSWLHQYLQRGGSRGVTVGDSASAEGMRVVSDYGEHGGGISHGGDHFRRRGECVHLFTRWLTDEEAAVAAAEETPQAHKVEPTQAEVAVVAADVAWLPFLSRAVTAPGC